MAYRRKAKPVIYDTNLNVRSRLGAALLKAHINERLLLLADIVAKVFLGGQTKFFRAADAFCERRCERPHRFIQNRPGNSVVALKSDTAAEKSKHQLSRDFPGRSIFDFCNNRRTADIGLSAHVG